jgi:hypothetical protein
MYETQLRGLWIIVDSEKYIVRAVAELGLFRWPEESGARSSASHGTRMVGDMMANTDSRVTIHMVASLDGFRRSKGRARRLARDLR